MDFEKCKEILIREHEAIVKAASVQKMLEKALFQRNWADYEAYQEALNSKSIEISIMEEEREKLFGGFSQENNINYEAESSDSELTCDDRSRFYKLCMQFTPTERNELCNIYRSLKLEALKLRMANTALLEYLNEIRTTMAGFFETAFPERGGKVYTQLGIPVSQDMRCMVLNQSM